MFVALSCSHKSNCVFPAVTVFVCCAASSLMIEIFHQGLKTRLAVSSFLKYDISRLLENAILLKSL